MGCLNGNNCLHICGEDIEVYFKAYQNIKSMINSFNNENKISKVFLISTKSIKTFIKLTKQYIVNEQTL